MADSTTHSPAPVMPPFAGSDARQVPYDQARVAVLPAPYEGTVSYGGGASHGPGAILAASEQLEMYDEELDVEIDSVGLFTLPPALPFPLPSPSTSANALNPEQAVAAIKAAAWAPLRDGKWLLTLGGEHSVTVGVLQALLEARDGKPFSILQVDAHADLRQSYGGTPLSHACVMARAHDLGLPFVQVGIRALCSEERAFIRQKGLEGNVFWDHQLVVSHANRWIGEVVERLGNMGEEVYITFDLDGLDPAIMPATGTPVPGGLSWHMATRLLRAVGQSHKVIGADITELAPMTGLHAPDFLAARLAFKLIGYSLLSQAE